MKKLISLILCCLICGITSAQLIKQKVEKQKKQSELDWYNCSFDRDSVYGAEVNKAYEYLNANKKKLKKRPIVALIGTGMDVEHEDLRQAIWINPKEKLNQKDDDRNGLIDDINGWNFLGGKDAQVVESLTREGEREFFRLKDKYADYIFDGKKYYKIINGTRQEVAAPENMEDDSIILISSGTSEAEVLPSELSPINTGRSHKEDFLRWKAEREAEGMEFYNRLSEVMETEDDLAVGDMVAFTNDYGVVFGPQEVLAFRKPWNGDRCVYLDSDAYWFPDRPDQLTLLSKKGAE